MFSSSFVFFITEYSFDVRLTDTCVLLVDEVDVPESPEKQKLLSHKQRGMSRSLTVQS